MSKQRNFDKVGLLGVEVDVPSLNEAINFICTRAANKSLPAGYVIKPYVEFFDRAYLQPELQDLLNNAELSVADGIAVLWAAHFLYAGPRTLRRFCLSLLQILTAPAELTWPVPGRAAGTNFTWPLLQAAATAKLRVYLIGKDTDTAIASVSHLITRTFPELIIVGSSSGRDKKSKSGQVSPAWLNQICDRLTTLSPDLVLVGMGFPLQETVCAQLAQRLDHGLLIGEGGTFDYESFGGTRRKAPEPVQRLGLEWFWRLIQEPKRLRRQLAIPRFIYRVWRSR